MLAISPRHKAITQYRAELANYDAHGVAHEGATRSAFQNLLAAFAPKVGWIVIPEQPLPNGKRPDATLRDQFTLPRGYWEAKDTKDDLDAEIRRKIDIGYPTLNTIFEDTQWAVLYQAGKEQGRFDLQKPAEVRSLLQLFFDFAEPQIESFEQAVKVFGSQVPTLAQGLLALVQTEYVASLVFRNAFDDFHALCRSSLNPKITDEEIQTMLVQHLLTERLFRTVFDNPDFTRRNVIAAEIEKVIAALTSRTFDRTQFLSKLDRFYLAIEAAARDLKDWPQKQAFMNTVYERFFQGFSAKQADTYGIVYTPQEIVDFMCASVAEVLEREFGVSLATPGVQVLDPCTGTGNFVVNLIRRIPKRNLPQKYANDLFANEVMLLPYYIASLNIEHAYFEQAGDYAPFEGMCFVDTLDIADRVAHKGLGERPLWIAEANAARVEREQQAKIMIVMGNPPYNMGQHNENENNKNRRYPVIDGRIRDTYARDSQATLKNKLSDAYVKFFRWAADRLQGRDGIVCFVTNNSFIDQLAFDGMRKHLVRDFTQIYHLDLHGNVRQNPKLSGTTHNVFGIQVGVGITVAIRSDRNMARLVRYCRVPDDWRRQQKLTFLAEKKSISRIDWVDLNPNDSGTWRTEGLRTEFSAFLPIGSREVKATRVRGAGRRMADTIFRIYSLGVSTNRDALAYSFDWYTLATGVSQFIEDYNAEVFRWTQAGRPRDIDSFVRYDKVKWSEHLKGGLKRGLYMQHVANRTRIALYRPFCKKYLYYDPMLNDRPALFREIVPTSQSEAENAMICLSGAGAGKAFHCLATRSIVDLHLTGDTQCFPLYSCLEDGSQRCDNITDQTLAIYCARYGTVTKWDIFHYVYGILHHPQYRERYAENLKRELPRIPLLPTRADFDTCVRVGKALMRLHLDYEEVEEWPLEWREASLFPLDWRVTKMKLSRDKTQLVYNDTLTLAGIPAECFEYRLGNRSALEWVIDQYQVTTDKRSGITSDPNRPDDPEYIAHLVGRVVRVSVETVGLVKELADKVSLDVAAAAVPQTVTAE